MRESSATHRDWLCDLGWPLLPVWDAVSASMCGQVSVITPLLSRPCGLALDRQPSPGHQGTVLALALLFSLRVCGGFSLGLRVPLFKGVADSLGVSPRALCVYVYVCTCIFLHVCPYLTCKNALCSVP